MPCVLVVGCGDIGVALAARLAVPEWQVVGARRHPERLPAGMAGLALDVTRRESLALLADTACDHVVVTLTPAERSESGYRRVFGDGLEHLLEALSPRPPRSLLFTSSTAVYHQDDGSWVDEDSPTRPQRFNGRVLLAAERRLAAWPGAVALRLGGIYGPGRGMLLRRVGRGEIAPAEPPRYTNRIHRDDAVGFIAHLLLLAESGAPLAARYCVVDSDPAPAHEVESWLARRLGVAAAPGPAVAPGANKRVSNRRMLETGYTLRHPGYRQGYAALPAPG